MIRNLITVPAQLRSWAKVADNQHKERVTEACVLALTDLFKRHRVEKRWQVIKQILGIAFKFHVSTDAIRKISERWKFQSLYKRDVVPILNEDSQGMQTFTKDHALSGLFDSPPSNPLHHLLGRPTARQRLLLLESGHKRSSRVEKRRPGSI